MWVETVLSQVRNRTKKGDSLLSEHFSNCKEELLSCEGVSDCDQGGEAGTTLSIWSTNPAPNQPLLITLAWHEVRNV